MKEETEKKNGLRQALLLVKGRKPHQALFTTQTQKKLCFELSSCMIEKGQERGDAELLRTLNIPRKSVESCERSYGRVALPAGSEYAGHSSTLQTGTHTVVKRVYEDKKISNSTVLIPFSLACSPKQGDRMSSRGKGYRRISGQLPTHYAQSCAEYAYAVS